MPLCLLFHTSDSQRDGQHCQMLPSLGEHSDDWAFIWEPIDVCTEGEVPCTLKGLTGLRLLFLVSRTQPSHFWRRQLVRTSLASGRRVRWGHLCSGWELFWHRVPCFCLLWMELEGAHPFPSFGRKAGSRRGEWTSLVDQWLGIHLPMQGTWVQSLVREDSTSWGVAKPVPHNYWADALEPVCHNYWVCSDWNLWALEPCSATREVTTTRESPRTAMKTQGSQEN